MPNFIRSVGLCAAAIAVFSASCSAQDFTSNRQTATTAGLYFKLPLGGKDHYKSAKNRIEYGFRMQFGQDHYDVTGRRINGRGFTNDVVKLKFGGDGFKAVSFSGRDMVTYENGKLMLEGGEDGDGKFPWLWVGLGTAAVVGTAAVFTLAYQGENHDCDVEPC